MSSFGTAFGNVSDAVASLAKQSVYSISKIFNAKTLRRKDAKKEEMTENEISKVITATPNSYQLMNNLITKSCIKNHVKYEL